MISSRTYERRLVCILFLTLGAVMLDRFSQMFLGPYLVRDLHLTGGQLGLLASVLGGCWALSSLALGGLSDRIGRRRVLIPAILVFSLCSWLSGLAQNFWQFLLIRAALGIAEGPCWSIVMALLDESSSPATRGRNVGIVNSAGSLIGAAVGPILVTQMAAVISWRWCFCIVGIPGVLLALWIFLDVREPRTNTARGSDRAAAPGGVWALARSGNLWLCMLGAFGVATVLFNFSIFVPLYVTQVAHQPVTLAGFLVGAAGLGGFVSSLVAPALSDRFGRKPVLIICALLCACTPLLFMIGGLYAHKLPMALLVMACFTTPGVAALVMVLIPTALAPAGLTGASIGFVNIGAELLGGSLSPLLGGTLADRYGLGAPLVLASCGGLVIALVAIALPRSCRGRSPGS